MVDMRSVGTDKPIYLMGVKNYDHTIWLIDTIQNWSTADDMSRVKSQNGMSLEVSHTRILSYM
jgi:hypothetical protein